MPSSFSHPTQEYRYPYSAFALGMLDANELQSEIIKAIHREPADYEVAYIQLPILVSQFGLSKEKAHQIVAQLQNLNIPPPANHRDALRYFVSQMEEIRHPPKAHRQAKQSRVNTASRNSAQSDINREDKTPAPKAHNKPSSEAVDKPKRSLSKAAKKGDKKGQKPKQNQTVTKANSSAKAADNIRPTATKKRTDAPTSTAPPLEEKKIQTPAGSPITDKPRSWNRKQRSYIAASLALLSISFICLVIYSLNLPSNKMNNKNDPKQVKELYPTRTNPDTTPPPTLAALEKKRIEREQRFKRQQIETAARKRRLQQAALEEARSYDQKLHEWLTTGSELAKNFHIGPPEEPERALHYLEKLKKEAPSHKYTAQLLLNIAEACTLWAEKILEEDGNAEMHQIYLWRAERYTDEANSILGKQ